MTAVITTRSESILRTLLAATLMVLSGLLFLLAVWAHDALPQWGYIPLLIMHIAVAWGTTTLFWAYSLLSSAKSLNVRAIMYGG